MRRDRAAGAGPELFLFERAFDDCLERIELIGRRFERGLLIGCPDSAWPRRLGTSAALLDVRDPGRSLCTASGGEIIIEDQWRPPDAAYDLVLAIGTLDTVNDLPLGLRLVRTAMCPDGLFIGALSGGDTLPQLRAAMREADMATGVAAPHVHPRIEPSALAPLLAAAGFANPVVDVDRAQVSYRALGALVSDLRAMGATNILTQRPRISFSKRAAAAATQHFAASGDGEQTIETFEILHFAAWTQAK